MTHREPRNTLVSALWQAEVAAARLEALLSVDAALATLWRTEAAVIEAVSTIELENVRISPADLTRRLMMNSAIDNHDVAVQEALSVLRYLKRPADVLSDPSAAVRRIEATSGHDTHDEAEKPGDAEWALIPEAVYMSAPTEQSPIGGAIRAALIYARITGHVSPARERLVFVSVESRLRSAVKADRLPAPSPQIEEPLSEAPLAALWITTPATALTRFGFRRWSLGKTAGLVELCEALMRSMSWELGQIAKLRHQLQRQRDVAAGRRGRSRHADFSIWIGDHPIFSSRQVMDGIAVTRRTALSLIEDFEAEGLLGCLTPRRGSRVWATRSLADRLAVRGPERKPIHRTVNKQRDQIMRSTLGHLSVNAPAPQHRIGKSRAETAYDEMDQLLRETDSVLSRFRSVMADRQKM